MTRKNLKIGGIITALISPFCDRGTKIDLERFKMQVDRQIRSGIAGLVPCGTTGEAPTLEITEQVMLIRTCVDVAAGRVPVIAGAGSNCTKDAVILTKASVDCGADATLHVVPYYNRPDERSRRAHFCAIANCTDKPVILYNIPDRTGKGTDMGAKEVFALTQECPSIIGIKEASGSVERVTELRRVFNGREFIILCGDDALVLPFSTLGAQGLISVFSNAYPEYWVLMWQDRNSLPHIALKRFENAYPIIKLLFKERNPVGIKCLMKFMGLDSGMLREPLLEATKELQTVFREQVCIFKSKIGDMQ
ncbi:MAG: 4-hydroxy-tetrahydrodipicolinate synthase [Candidatus Taylorbacteria bacterium RIFCSPLOWO2_02_FULL_43_11]|uniref:4-hydroxy-tetrahydrodipicolinate synthase n=1 Tax=Candidatus Taylorbacteria bacterium RIFCSPHIGHO2_02_FULL_43_32b TaxID=1802306 RepID=A0A1G2MKI7_9BACT|nr:MAG: 4-hydroxy-tetrahydrodipicolinate synthase [Candidatus Taylorbacteria bacterium RIFCSPHIGHO2_01_FULL_43_47]OHA24455.1 MAG: 4-hydroxy-tetrahydrodipicolinate synthase [Candidatus Taylorbacteria bacterium RIFCSPHIGHO2_02_FULL_43_32b]OHA35355.1 MAG: 4-hydroxy-tetrahydrodipicolinate synthase [Candidatus Taylorbacteria bacterium RIFCSPLOWO2_02_FULL_43_11]